MDESFERATNEFLELDFECVATKGEVESVEENSKERKLGREYVKMKAENRVLKETIHELEQAIFLWKEFCDTMEFNLKVKNEEESPSKEKMEPYSLATNVTRLKLIFEEKQQLGNQREQNCKIQQKVMVKRAVEIEQKINLDLHKEVKRLSELLKLQQNRIKHNKENATSPKKHPSTFPFPNNSRKSSLQTSFAKSFNFFSDGAKKNKSSPLKSFQNTPKFVSRKSGSQMDQENVPPNTVIN